MIADDLIRLKQMLEAPNATGPQQVDVFIGEPTAVMDSDDRAHAYIALYPGVGIADSFEEALCAAPGPERWGVQATCAGGDITRTLRAVERLNATLMGKQLRPDSGFIRKNGDLGPVRKDPSTAPARWYVPIDLTVTI